MTSYHVTLGLHASPAGPQLADRLDGILDALYDTAGVRDVDYGAALARGVVEFTGYVDASSPDSAAQRFSVAVRAAVRRLNLRAGPSSSTAHWPSPPQTISPPPERPACHPAISSGLTCAACFASGTLLAG